jgi:hypothetical protein
MISIGLYPKSKNQCNRSSRTAPRPPILGESKFNTIFMSPQNWGLGGLMCRKNQSICILIHIPSALQQLHQREVTQRIHLQIRPTQR